MTMIAWEDAVRGKSRRSRHARHNPKMSTGATVALVAVAGAAVIGGYYLYKNANTGGKSTSGNPTNYPLTVADFVANKAISAKVGDTVTVTVGPAETLSASGGVSGSGMNYTVNSSGSLTLTQQVGSFSTPLGTVTFTV